jgi:DeoR/GlpR family transcriptional regulator of sugar metabolism
VSALRSLHLDAVFMGVHGMSARAGFTTPNLMEAETNRAFVEATEHLVVLADHTKWGVTGLSSMAPLERATALITDSGLAASAKSTLEENIGRVILADTSFSDDLEPAHERRRA